jgi:hypothetical protein
VGEKTKRCIDCSTDFTVEQVEDAQACPACGSESVPVLIADDVFVHLNWRELRILGIWASCFAEQHADPRDERTLLGILRRLELQNPGMPKLTIDGDVKELASILGGDVEVRTGQDIPPGEQPS